MMTRTIHHSETPSGNARSRNLQLRSIAIYARIYTAGNSWNSSKSFRMLMTVSTGDSAVNSSSINTKVSSLCDSPFHNLQNCYKVN